jgi:hypothetical protein
MLVALALLLTAPSALPLEQAARIEPIGWSSDAQRVALRVFYGANHIEAPRCDGYVDADGKPFEFGLALVVLKGTSVEHTFIIQRSPTDESCTPLPEAKRALEAAKRKLEQLGIDVTKPGRVLAVKREQKDRAQSTKDEAIRISWKETWRAMDDERLALEVALTLVSVEDEGVIVVETRAAAWTRWPSSGEPVSGTFKLPKRDFTRRMGGNMDRTLVALASPDGERVVAFMVDRFSNARGNGGISRLLALP